MVVTRELEFKTAGNAEMRDITADVAVLVRDSGLTAGIVTVFVPGATGALTTIEYEDGALSDFQRLFDELAAQNREYRHNLRWGDGNGHSHVRAALLGPDITVPFVSGRLTLGTWQQLIFVDFDNRSRNRKLVVQIMGE